MDINVFMAWLVIITEIMVLYVCPATIVLLGLILLYYLGSWIYRRIKNKCGRSGRYE